MAPQRIVNKLQKEWNEHPEYTKEDFVKQVRDCVNENDDIGYVCICRGQAGSGNRVCDESH